ncbi:PREDICTED: lymphocyte transmembrane adapter 1 isoform X1 [Miniopterus natalensis]|uniref:lymphocyte transmembrane adapter 1 isoform X1 n=1 Tax=Miniopterus natalensis TaxID=291302 RepID=UPI0007A71A5C|nr:PREDICTED: lymphocyte transmembrane adapter 1 isoform X1 [Miniopterus natalensis]
MDVITPTLSEIRGRTPEPSTLKVTLSRLDGDQDQSSSIFSGFAGLLAVLLAAAALCALWNWSKRKKRRVPYLHLLTLPPSRRRASNIYDLLPRRQEVLGRHQVRSTLMFSVESLLSRNSDSPSSGNVTSQAGDALQVHRAQPLAVGIYDNAAGPGMCGDLTPSAHCVGVRMAGDYSSISSEGSREYVNVPTAEEIAETLASTNNPAGDLFVLPSAQERGFTEGDEGCGHASDCTSFLSPGTESNDPLSDEEGSSQTSNDYVNMAEFSLGAMQEQQPWVSFQCCRDYENVPPADPNGSQQQAEEVTSSNTNRVEGRTDGLGTHVQPVMQPGRFLVLGDYVIYQPSAQSENSQMEHGEEMSNGDSNDYDVVLAAKLGGGDSEQEPNPWLLPDELRPTCPAGKPQGLAYPAKSK